MKCPICGNELRPSKKDPAYGLCDNCRKKFKLANLENTVSEEENAPTTEQREVSSTSRTKKSSSSNKKSSPKTKSSKNRKPVDRPEKSAKSAKSVKSKKPADTFDFDDDFEPKKKKKKGGCFKFLLIFILIIALAGAACFFLFQKYMNKGTSESKATEESVETPTTNSSLSGVGSSEEQNNVKITLVNATESTGGDYTTPSDGNIFLVCEFEVVNNSEADININSLADIEAYCGDYSVSEDITGLLLPEAENKNSLDGTVAAGETLTGVAVYQVPADYTGMELRVFPEAWSESASFTITNE